MYQSYNHMHDRPFIIIRPLIQLLNVSICYLCLSNECAHPFDHLIIIYDPMDFHITSISILHQLSPLSY
jgi:hypothetical protein